jgi:hypothetical protein
LYKLKDPVARKLIYQTFADMMTYKLPGSRLFRLILTNLKHEREEYILHDLLAKILPLILENYMPLDKYEKSNDDVFELIKLLLKNKVFDAPSTV